MATVISDKGQASNPYLHKIRLVRGDITGQEVDAIVSLLPPSLDFTGSINKALLNKAGQQLDEFVLENMYQPKAGDIYAVPAFDLPCRNIIFSVRPPWRSDFEREDKHLVICVRKAMVLAKCMLLPKIAFPPLASGKKGFPKQRAARLLIQGIIDRLDEQSGEIRIVCPDDETGRIYKERLTAAGWRGHGNNE